MYKYFTALVALSISVPFIGCGSKPPPPLYESPASSSAPASTTRRAVSSQSLGKLSKRPADALSLPSEQDRMVSTKVTLSIRADDPDAVQRAVVSLAYEFDGYILHTEKNVSTIRLPSKYFPEAFDRIEKMGDVIERLFSGKDVTEAYTDLQTRLENILRIRERYLMLLDQADKLEDILRLESVLSGLNQKIETLKGKIERYSHLVEYTTITVKAVPHRSPMKPGPVAWIAQKFFGGIKSLFVAN